MRRCWPAWFAGLLALFAVHAALQHFSGALWAGAVSSALLAVVALAAAGCGRTLLRLFGIRGARESEKTLVGATLGLGALSQGVLLLGALGWLRTGTALALIGAFWVAGSGEMRGALASLGADRRVLRERPLLAGGVLALLGLTLWLAWVPPHQYDSLVYHMPLAQAYAREGRIVVLPELLFSHFPQNGEMLYALALLLGSDLLAQMFTWLGTFLSVWWLLEAGKRELPVAAVLLACLLTVSHTAVLLLTPTTYVECLVMLWVTASVLSFLRWRAGSNGAVTPRGWLALSGIFAGLGLGTKYYAGICPAVLGLALLGRWIAARPLGRGPRGASAPVRLKDGLVFFAAAFAAGAPWLIKNAVTVGNPVFPFLYRLFPMRGVDWAGNAVSASRYFEVLTEYGHVKGQFLKDLLQFPYLAAAGSTRFGGGADVLGSFGWGLLFAAVPLAVWAAWSKRTLRWICLYCAAHWAVWFCTGVVLRFLVVLVPLASLLAAAGLHRLWGRLGGPGRGLLAVGVAVCLWTNLALFLYVNIAVDSFPLLLGAVGRHEFLSRKFDYYPCAAHARDTLPKNDKILVVGEQRGYYVRQPHVVTTPMAPNRFVIMANAAETPADLARRLREEGGFRYVLLVPREGRRLGEEYGVFHFTERGYENWAGLESGLLETVFEDPGRCVLAEVR
ncbi:MAG: hypothetical protein ABII00_08185 [Elusimicrobiota bacterium]